MEEGNSSKTARRTETTSICSPLLGGIHVSPTNKENAQDASLSQFTDATKSSLSSSAMKSIVYTEKLLRKEFRGAGGDCPPFLFHPDPNHYVRRQVDTQEEIFVNEVITEESLLNYESHFSWILPYGVTRQQLITFRERLEIWKEETEDAETSYCHTMTKYLEQLVLDFLIGNGQEDALISLDLALSEFPEDLPVEQHTAYMYLFQIEKCYIMFRNNDQNGSKELLKTIKGMDISIPRTHATILAVKATFLGLLGDTEKKLHLIKEVIDMDPDFPDWYQFLFSTLRRSRRERVFTSTPTDEEVNACHKAYNLNPNSPIVFQQMAVLYEDILKAHNSGQSNKLLDEKGKKKMSLDMICFARKACDLNSNSISANIKLAEMLSSSGIDKERRDLDASEEQFNFCLREWPKSSHVLHKVGKFYIRPKNDLKKGLNLMEKALEGCSDNYPCLMDYLRELFKQSCNAKNGYYNKVQLEKLIEILDDKIPEFKLRKVYCGRLKCLKGAVLWKLKLEDDALDVWLEALIHDPNLINDDIMAVMSGSIVFRNMLNAVDFETILDKLKTKLTTHSEQIEEDIYRHIQLLTEVIQKDLEDWHLFQNEKLNNPNWRQSSSRQKVGQKHLNRMICYISECEEKPDWRSNCGVDLSSDSDTSSLISANNYPEYFNSFGDRNQHWQRRFENHGHMTGNKHRRTPSSSNGSGDGYGLSSLQRSRECYGSSTSISTIGTQASCSSIGSSYSRNYGFPRPYNKNRFKYECDMDDNWRRK